MDFLESFQDSDLDTTVQLWEESLATPVPRPEETNCLADLPLDVFSVIFKHLSEVSITCKLSMTSRWWLTAAWESVNFFSNQSYTQKIFDQMLFGKRFEAQRASRFRLLAHLEVGSVYGHLGEDLLNQIATHFKSVTILDISRAEELTDDIAALGKMHQLTSLNIDYCMKLESHHFIQAAATLTRLTFLSAQRVPVQCWALTSLVNLEYLNLARQADQPYLRAERRGEQKKPPSLVGLEHLTNLTSLTITKEANHYEPPFEFYLDPIGRLPLVELNIDGFVGASIDKEPLWAKTLHKLSWGKIINHGAKLARVPQLERLESLDVSHRIDYARYDKTDDWSFLGMLPNSLKEIDLDGTSVKCEHIAQLLVSCPNLKRLSLLVCQYIPPKWVLENVPSTVKVYHSPHETRDDYYWPPPQLPPRPNSWFESGIYVTFRGTKEGTWNWMADALIVEVQFKGRGNQWVHLGFYNGYESIRDRILAEYKRVQAWGVLATIAAGYDFGASATVITFGAPRPGDGGLAQFMANSFPNFYRLTHACDWVPRVPFPHILWMNYIQAGSEIFFPDDSLNYHSCGRGESHNCNAKCGSNGWNAGSYTKDNPTCAAAHMRYLGSTVPCNG